jgi:AAA+ ATPase superfamily predicted ATPase
MSYQLEQVYPKWKQILFTNRKKELDFILEKINLFSEKNIIFPLTLIGLRRTGKTMLLLETLKRTKTNSVYFNFQKISMEPISFSKSIIKTVLSWLTKTEKESSVELSLEWSKEVTKKIDRLEKSYARLDYTSIINDTFDILKSISEKEKFVFLIDEFQEILKLNSYKEIENIINLFRTHMQSQNNILYIFSGSNINLMNEIFFDSSSALFSEAKNIQLYPLDKISSKQLINKLIKTSDKNKNYIYKLIRGNPFYLYILCNSLGKEINIDVIKREYLRNLIESTSSLYNYFDYLFENLINSLPSKTGVKNILLYLARKEGIKLVKLSEELTKSTAYLNNLLKKLLKLGVLLKENSQYYFVDPVFRDWIRLYELDIGYSEQTQKSLERYLADIEEKYLRASSELGKTKEYEWKVKMEKKFGLKLENYSKKKY